jgi:peptidyl-prolyl cis-trans isomerase D
MATLQTIRNRAGVLVSVVIGLSLLAFVLSDFIGSGSMFGGPDYEIAVINGKSVEYMEYEQVFDGLIENYKRNMGTDGMPEESVIDMIREQTWDILIKKYTLENEIALMGIKVSEEELFDMVQGTNIDPQILQIPVFQNQQTGMFDRALVVQFLQNMDKDPSGNARASWLAFEEQLVQGRRVAKYNNMIKKAMYVPAVLAQQYHKENMDKTDCRFVFKPYSLIPDSTIECTDIELKAYYDANNYKYEQEEMRDIDYVVFDILPSPQDMEFLQGKMMKIKEEFTATDDDVSFVNYNSDNAFEDKFYSRNTLNPEIDSLLFASQIGFIYGPYIEGNNLVLAKLIEKKMFPDSVHARHILIQPNENRSQEVAKSLTDSLLNLLKNKADFVQLVMRYSDDKGSVPDGGDLKWFGRGRMVKPFEDTCFTAKVNEYKIVESQFGYHIVQVLEKSKESEQLKVAFVQHLIEPSQQTRQQIFNAASDFVSKATNYEEFKKLVGEKGMVKRTANNLAPNERNIAGLESPREVIRWAYNNASKNDVSDIYELGDKFVVAALTEVKEKGIAPMEQVREQLLTEVRKNKKAAQFSDEFKKLAYKTIDELGANIQQPVNDAQNITFNSFSLPYVGIEPEVIAAISISPKGKMSEPLKGNNGVFVFEVINNIPSDQTDYSVDKIRIANEWRTRVEYQTFEAMKKKADIKDKRVKFL